MPKMKTHKGATKRFKTTGSGKVKRYKAFKSHILTKKTSKRKRNLRRATTVGTNSNKIGIAELADCARPVLFAAAPKVASTEATEHRRLAGVGSLSLQRVEDFLDGVRHFAACSRYAAGSDEPASANPRNLSWHASQCPHASPFAPGS